MPIQPPGHIGPCWVYDRVNHALYCPACRRFMAATQTPGAEECCCRYCSSETMCVEHLNKGQRLLLEP